ncbi:hypothetical protein [uncultured Erythrobacter sp.]|uniref:hypothetical protein n=1 Tax=uncultured Erythrobacter sp. TaxID=263913 RepID=UPI00260EAC43|nr:hypothetical protein [uncultured Erythrobacter sp.]
MTTHFTELAKAAAADGTVDPQEVLALRRQGWGDGVIHQDEAEALFALNDALDQRDSEWCDFFVEAIGEYVLNGTPPRLQCDDAEARWLIAQIDHDGVVDSVVELETIVRIIERAENVPTLLKDYVVKQIEQEVLTGTGPTRCGGELSDTHITGTEAKILRRVIFASGGCGPAAVSRFEAEMLFRLKDATLASANSPEWEQLFLDGVENYLKGFTVANAQLDHDRRLELQRFVADNEPNVGRFMSRMVREAPNVSQNFANAMGVVFGKRKDGAVSEHAGEKIVAASIEGAKVTQAEKDWVNTMVEADGELDDLERRLIARIAAAG